jgi:uncharacterized protein
VIDWLAIQQLFTRPLRLVSRALVATALATIRAYRYFLSPFWGVHCRFTPTCSVYAEEALQTHGFFRGSALAIYRIGRCQPWCNGGLDPVPPRRKRDQPGVPKNASTSLSGPLSHTDYFNQLISEAKKAAKA